MLNKIVKKEKALLSNFFDKKINVPVLPNWITNELLKYWQKNKFNVHYLPRVTLDEDLNLPLWKNKPKRIFYKKIQRKELKEKSKKLPGKWILIDARDKPKRKVPWIWSSEVKFLEKVGLKPKNYLKKWNKQAHREEYLLPVLKRKGFGSRFCLTINEINDLKPFILNFLKIKNKKVRLPFFIEYNYLGNAIYKQWGSTRTWEWLEDELMNGQHLASGNTSVGIVGWDPQDYWSTILTFRPVIIL